MRPIVHAAFLLALSLPAHSAAPLIERISISSQGDQANAASYHSALSADGRYVAFSSAASNLVEGDTNGAVDIFVRDRQTGTTERISINAEGQEGNAASGIDVYRSEAEGDYRSWDIPICSQPDPESDLVCPAPRNHGIGRIDALAMSGDGRFIAFSSRASNLVADDTNNKQDIFVYDRQNRTIERVSHGPGMAEANGRSFLPSLSQDGRFVAYLSAADNLIAGDSNGEIDVFVTDRSNGATERVNVSGSGQPTDATTRSARISANGYYVIFSSDSQSWAPSAKLGYARNTNVFVHDRKTGQTSAIDNKRIEFFSPSAMPAVANNGEEAVFLATPFQSFGPSCGGRINDYAYLQNVNRKTVVPLEEDYYRYFSGMSGSCLVLATLPQYTPIDPGMWVENPIEAFETIALSGNEHYVFFNQARHVMRYDRISRSSEPVSYDPAIPPTGPAARDHLGGVSADGRITSFTTDSEQRISGDDNGVADIIVTQSAGDEDTVDLGVEFGRYKLSQNGDDLQLTIKVIN
ncbi:TolB family protein [Methylomicrobium agile]|uniref:TolB family protein n=1 Tax=Methylomicrobium agile TaxID=39774 RepID=UPI0004DF8099|nr:hypothetical protein [Methylomicrobium agile]